ncbi:hypothetical protein RHMOL_Rhmol01G0289000 [Rhododendron molle]|uniref:Uncharacterized protein n=1 Tax=Rhododendron molle TaxID=49168 RepID=A0ACC0Q806_RHOML|nr:hypothetical protein RHMOL_Rhmol01G0289000 [Rhododendron molle]
MDRQRNIERNSAVLSALGLKTMSKALFGSQRPTKYEMDRQRNIERNSEVLSALRLKTMSKALFGSNLTAKKKTIKEGKSKMNCCNDDEEYQSCEDEEGMSSCKDVASSRFQANKAELDAKLKEQSQANVTDLLSKEHVSVSVLGKRSVFLKEYGSSKNNPSSFKQLQALDSDVIILQHQIGEQAKALAELSKTLTKHTRTMAVLQDIVRVLAVPTDIVELIEMSNNAEGASDKRRDAGSIGLSKG